MADKNEISELEELVQDQKPEEPPDESSLKASTIAYQVAIVIVDGLTGATIAAISYWYYGVVWFLAGAISFFLHHKNWDSPRNNEKQVENAQTGMIVSVVAMVIMALAAAYVWVTKITSPYIEVAIVLPILVLFFWHAFQLAMYRFADDKFVIERAIASAKANAHKKVQIAKAAGTVVAASKDAIAEKNRQYERHGDRGAVDAAINKIGGRPMQSMAADTHKPTLRNEDNQETSPTLPPRH
jgi:hypothetical protein